MDFEDVSLEAIYEAHKESDYCERIPVFCQDITCHKKVYVRVNDTGEYLCKYHGADVIIKSARDDERYAHSRGV